MEIFLPTVAPRVIFVLGIINLVTGILIALTCRCAAGSKVTGKLMQYAGYKRLLGYHCYIWWVFWASVIVHAIFAIGLLGNPFS